MQQVGEENIFIFGLTADQVASRRAEGYDPAPVIEDSPRLKAALDAIASGEFSDGDGNRYTSLLDGLYHGDYFMLAADFDDYLRAQRDVGAAYRDTDRWFRAAVLNTAGMGYFSSDRTIRQYDAEIWHAAPWLREE